MFALWLWHPFTAEEINKTMRTIGEKKKKSHGRWGGSWVFIASLFSNPGTLTCICPTFSWDILKGIKMTAPALKAPKVLPNYRFLSQGHSGMRSKMDYVPTLTLSFSLFLSPPFLPFFALYCFHPPSFSRSPSPCLMAYTCQPSGRGTAVTKWNAPSAPSRAVPPQG